MRSEWVVTPLGNLLSLSNGKSSPKRSNDLPYPVYGANGIIGFSGEANATPGTIIIGRVGSYCGSLYFSNDSCWVTDNAIRANALNGNDAKFLYYLLHTFRLNDWRTGSGQPLLNQTIISQISATIPSLSEQRRIAHILGTLDDKIELNRQMNETLEAIARAIFKSWFMDFDPVRAKMEGRLPVGMDAATATLFPSAFQDSPLGKIPKGWEVVSLPEAIEVNPRRVLKKGTTAPYLHMQNLPTQGHRPRDWIHREFSSGTKFINGDTLLARITPCIENGKTGFVDFLDEGEVGWGSTEYIVLRPKPPLPVEFGYYLARSDNLRVFAIHNMTGTTGRQRVPASCFDYYQFPVPITPIAQRFSEIVQPLMEKIRVNSEQSRTLSQIRDALLPKLLSGEIRVDDVDKKLEVKDGGTS